MVYLRETAPFGGDVENSADDSWLSDEELFQYETNSEDSHETSPSSDTSVSSLSCFTPSPPSSPVTMNFGKRRPFPPPFLRKRMRLLPPRKEPVVVSGPYIVSMLSEEEINEDLNIIKEGLNTTNSSLTNGMKKL